MKVELFCAKIHEIGIETITGIPDSTLRIFCDYIENVGKDIFTYRITPGNEGEAVGIAVGEYLATGKPACVYMQNSGLGNIVNPITSLANKDVYGIPMLLVVGWRGEPGIKDEPQHKFMGKITGELLKVLDIPYCIVDADTTEGELDAALQEAVKAFQQNKQYALVVKIGTFEKEQVKEYRNDNTLIREDAIGSIVEWLTKDDIVVSTTGKISRELYEQSDRRSGSHDQIFMSVGGMGHANMIAYQLAHRYPERKVVCVDGDGALLMHMGSLAVFGQNPAENMVHICLNNEAHESVGGMPTGAPGITYAELAKSCGYQKVYLAAEEKELKTALLELRHDYRMAFLEIRVAIGARADLGRPRETAQENRNRFMKYHGALS